ncbi:MAG: NADH-quinone oxidoreductase subunit H [Candidatus Bathyarchaeota archaeon]|nr:NADH-quinone oxidoreductase subunit H [Candidatus Bathyarchaeota archaeon]
MNPILTAVQVLLFPGLSFILSHTLYAEWLSRKTVARLQNRTGPLHTGWQGILQPVADYIKLLVKEDITPAAAEAGVFNIVPVFIFAIPLAATFLIPIQSITTLWGYEPVAAFEGDLIMVLFLMSLTVLAVFLAGWSSGNLFGAVGATRVAFMMLAYEIPLGLVAISPAIMAKSLSIVNIVDWQVASVQSFLANPTIPGFLLGIVMFIGFAIYTVCLLAELEMRPFDMSEAETEIVHGWQVEYSGVKLALLNSGHDVKMVLAAGLLTSLYLGGPAGPILPPVVWFIIKTSFCVLILSNLSALFARFRIDQMVTGAWKYLVPLAVLQVMATVALSGVI